METASTLLSAIRKALGSAARTKTPTGFCANTFRAGLIWRSTPRLNSAESRADSTSGPEKRWTSKLWPGDLMSVLHRPVESAADNVLLFAMHERPFDADHRPIGVPMFIGGSSARRQDRPREGPSASSG
jgi:hypothetical protein